MLALVHLGEQLRETLVIRHHAIIIYLPATAKTLPASAPRQFNHLIITLYYKPLKLTNVHRNM
jgi:hypothetical protein